MRVSTFLMPANHPTDSHTFLLLTTNLVASLLPPRSRYSWGWRSRDLCPSRAVTAEARTKEWMYSRFTTPKSVLPWKSASSVRSTGWGQITPWGRVRHHCRVCLWGERDGREGGGRRDGDGEGEGESWWCWSIYRLCGCLSAGRGLHGVRIWWVEGGILRAAPSYFYLSGPSA